MKTRPVTVFKDDSSGQSVVDYIGTWLGWGVNGKATQAIIQKDSGAVELVRLDRFMFDDTPPKEA